MRPPHRSTLVWVAFVTAALAWSAVAVVTLRSQQAATTREAKESRSAQVLLTGLLDQETSARAFIATAGDEAYLGRLGEGRRTFAAATRKLRPVVAGVPRLRRSLARQSDLAREWGMRTDRRIADVRAGAAIGPALPADGRVRRAGRARAALVDRFRAENARFQRQLAVTRATQAAGMTRDAIVLVVVVGIALAGGAILLVLRSGRAEVLREEARSEFAAALATAADEQEAQDLIARHLVRIGPVRRVQVLVPPVDALDGPAPAPTPEKAPALERAVAQHGTGACLALRDGRVQRQGERAARLRPCGLCAGVPGATTCAPLVVGGEPVGAVVAEHDRALPPQAERALLDGAAQAAPFLGNLRTLARARRQAATDGLTGLPNRRAVEETLAHLLAQAHRSITPLSVVILDLDHFKRINDTLGHAAGDAALASVGRLLRRAPRASDVAGRWGGEEFVLLLPDTDAAGAHTAAEGLRAAVGELGAGDGGPRLTASMGIASYPEHAGDAESLLRFADDALYAAKDAGRDRVAVSDAIAL